MHKKVAKSKNNTNTNSRSLQTSVVTPPAFTDNRPEAITQLKTQQNANAFAQKNHTLNTIQKQENNETISEPHMPEEKAPNQLLQLEQLIKTNKSNILKASKTAGKQYHLTEEKLNIVIQKLQNIIKQGDHGEGLEVLNQLNKGKVNNSINQALENKGEEQGKKNIQSEETIQRVKIPGLDIEIPDSLFLILIIIVLALFFILLMFNGIGRRRTVPTVTRRDIPRTPPVRARTPVRREEERTVRRRTPARTRTPSPPPRTDYGDGATIGFGDYRRVKGLFDTENRLRKTQYTLAAQQVNVYQTALTAYRYDRRQNYLPNNGGGTVQVNGQSHQQAYANAQGYFPVGGAPYTEYHVNHPSDYRKIEPNANVGTAIYWMGYNITHVGAHWARVWTTNGYWQAWNTGTHAATDLAAHVGGAAPVQPALLQRNLARDGYIKKSLIAHGSFTFRVRVERSRV